MAAATDDFYATLGLEREATAAEITKTFRKLALKHHPDRGGDPEIFTSINKAYEVLSDPKARARYDGTGRTAPLSVEEEFRESFFGGGLLSQGTQERRYGASREGSKMSDAQREEARRKEEERREAQRRLDEADRRDAERRARLSGGNGAAPPAAAQPPQPSPTAGTKSVGLAVGTRVRLDGLNTRPELNGKTGVLIAQREDKWQVRLDNNEGEKLLKAKNLFPEAAAAAPPAAVPAMQAAAPPKAAAPQAAAPAPKASAGGPPNGGTPPVQGKRCADATCNYLVHTDPSISRTHCCRACAGRPRGAPPDHGPVCQHRVAPPSLPRGDAAPEAPRPAASQAPAPASHRTAKKAAEPEPTQFVPAPRPGPALDASLPTQQYQVLPEYAFVRQEPQLTAPAYGKKKKGESVVAAAETFDGWVHLANEPGWIIKDMQGRNGVGQVLLPVGRDPVLATHVRKPGPLRWQVFFKPHVAVRAGPSKEAQIMGVKKHGEEVVTVLQTYGGWVQIESGGWMLTSDQSLGQLLVCRELDQPQKGGVTPNNNAAEDRSRVLAELHQAVDSKEVGRLRSSLARARACGLSDAETQWAATLLSKLIAEDSRREAQLKQLRQRLENAKNNERELRECLDEGAKQGFREESLLAQRLLDELLAQRSKTQQQHQGLLDQLAAAAKSGDKLQMKQARDAAKKGGVDMKDIARIFSLNIISSGEQAASEAPAGGAPEASAPSAPCSWTTATPSVEKAAGQAEEVEPGLALGVRVRLEGLAERPALNGSTGVLVHRRAAELWQVLLDSGGMKLCRAKFLSECTGPPDVAPIAAYAAEYWGSHVPGSGSAAPDEPEEPQEPRGAIPGADGRWVSSESGEWMATITGTTIQWADGPAVDLLVLSERSFSCEMSAEGVTETFSAELDSEGRLAWSDGDLWIRSAV